MDAAEIPYDALALVLAHLRVPELVLVRRVASLWALAASKVASAQVSPAWSERIGFQALRSISLLSSLRSLDLTDCAMLEDGLMHHIKPLTLTSLNLSGCAAIGDRSLEQLASYQPHLRSLSLAGCKGISLGGFQHLKSLSELRSLSLEGTNADHDILEAIRKGLSGLTELNLDYCEGLWNVSFESPPFPSLRTLRLPSERGAGLGRNFLPASLESLSLCSDQLGECSGLTQLSSLTAYDLRIFTLPEALNRTLTRLEILSSGSCSLNFADLVHAVELEHLVVHAPTSSPSSLDSLRSLRYLEIRSPPFGDPGMEALVNLNRLETLVLESWKISNKGIAHIGHLTRLTSLHLHSLSKVSNAGLAAIGPLPKLRELFVVNSQSITTVEAFQDAPLIALSLRGCTLFPSDEVEKLTACFPLLSRLSLSECSEVNDSAVKPLHALPLLAELNLQLTSITQSSIEWIMKCTNLKALSVAGTSVTVSSLPTLASLPSLELIDLRNTASTRATVKSAKFRPNVLVLLVEDPFRRYGNRFVFS